MEVAEEGRVSLGAKRERVSATATAVDELRARLVADEATISRSKLREARACAARTHGCPAVLCSACAARTHGCPAVLCSAWLRSAMGADAAGSILTCLIWYHLPNMAGGRRHAASCGLAPQDDRPGHQPVISA